MGLLGKSISAFVLIGVTPLIGFGSVASKLTGRAQTSANLSTNATVRKQQLLVDPATTGDVPLTLTFARLDLTIHLDTPLGVTAQNIVQSIDFSALAPHFIPDPSFTEPFYAAGAGSFGVTFTGPQDIRVSDFVVDSNPQNPPPAGEVDDALINVAYNNFLPKATYDNILATYTVTTNAASMIKGTDGESIFPFDAAHIDPASDSGLLGVPEPALLAPGAFVGLIALGRHLRRARS